MSIVRRAFIVIATAGWLMPLCISYWATYDFLWNVVWPAAAFDRAYMSSYHPIDYADELFYFAMVWLGTVLAGWTVILTGRNGGR